MLVATMAGGSADRMVEQLVTMSVGMTGVEEAEKYVAQ